MRRSCVYALAFFAAFFAPAVAAAQVSARIWLDDEPDYFQRGDRMDVSFAVSDDAYVAVVHVDTDGNLDFVYPASPWDNEFVRGGEIHRLPTRGGDSWLVRGRAGIGYFYLIASPEPLDFGYFRGRTGGSPWDWGYAGRVIHGDPFIAFEQLARLLMPRWPYAPYAFDYYNYYVEGIHRYPTYACSDRYYDYGWGYSPSYGSCNQLDYFLRDYPYYYDTRRFRGDRRLYLRDYDSLDPRHGFKEDPERPARGITPGDSWTSPSPAPSRGAIPRRVPAADPGPSDRSRAVPAGPERRGTVAPSGGGAPVRDRPSPSLDSRRPPDPEPAPAGDRRPARGRP